MADFVDRRSIVRSIWGDADVILVIFAGAAAEFALNRAVDWLFFTNWLPSDPIGRLFSTARYAQEIVFVDEMQAYRTLDRIVAAHTVVEERRGTQIPDWAYRDVLYMLIDYSERAYRALRRPLTQLEREDLYLVFYRVGAGLGIPDLPLTYHEWCIDRQLHLERDLIYSDFTAKLYEHYRKHLGPLRYRLLLELQAALAPQRVLDLLRLQPSSLIEAALRLYGLCNLSHLRSLVYAMLVPLSHLDDVKRLQQTG